MKFQLVKGENSVILTVFIQDSSSGVGDGLAGLDQTSGIVGGYVKRNDTGVALVVDENVTTEGTYEAPSTVGQVRIGTPANMIAGTYELHFHNDLFTTEDWVTVTLDGATDMAPLTLEIQLTNFNLNDPTPDVNVLEWFSATVANSPGTGRPLVDIDSINDSSPAAVNLKQSCLAIQVIQVQTAEAAANTATEFDTDLPLENDDYYGSDSGGLVIAFVAGTAQQFQTKRIVASATGTLNTRVTVEEAFDGIPADSDTGVVLGRITELT